MKDYVKYKNISGNSGVLAYTYGNDYVKVVFKNEDFVYLYNYSTPGRQNTKKKKHLAVKGKGLSTFISREVKGNYASKFKLPPFGSIIL